MKASTASYKRRNIKIWNEIAPRYHRRWAGADSGPFQSTDRLIELLHVGEGDRALDVACGTGAVTRRLSVKTGRAGYVVGTDTSNAAIKIAKRWCRGPNVHFVNMDAERFRFAEKFDVVTCQFALFFFPNAPRALRNMKGALGGAGRLGIVVHGRNVPFFASVLDAVTEFVPDYMPAGTPQLDRYGTRSALREEVGGAGFSGISVKDFVFRHSPGTFENYWHNYLRYVARPLREKLRSLDRRQRARLKEAVCGNVRRYTKKNGVVEFPWQVLILTAKK